VRHIQLQSRHNDEDWKMRFVDKTDYDELFDEDVFVRKPNGDPLCVILKNVIPKETNALAWSVLKNYNVKTENRSIASGIEAEPRKKMDGTYSKTTRVPKGWEVVSGIIGFFERSVRFPYGHACAWNDQHPEKFARVIPLCEKVNELYKQYVPERWNYQKSVCDRTPKDYIVGDTVFTTITVNMNFRTSCHKDAGDLADGFSCLSVIRQGAYTGGHLVFPNYRIAAELRTGDLILFDPHEYHGNTQIVPLSPDAKRCSLVYYFRDKIQHCGPMKDELERAKNRKPGDPLYDYPTDNGRQPGTTPPSTT